MGTLADLEILVVDDNEQVRNAVSLLLQKSGYSVRSVESGPKALETLNTRYYDLVITDYKMKPMDGMQLLIEIKQNWPATEVMMITAYGSISKGVQAIKRGAFDYITKPFEDQQLLDLITRLVDVRSKKQKRETLAHEIRQHSEFDPIIGHSPKILQIMNVITRVARSDTTVLIIGESGTGKELIAQAIHARSKRKANPFVAINCGAIPEGLQESELFGHVKGAFTGADAIHKGLFEVGDKGTVFLDEIAEMAPSMQVKLLRFLQDNEFRRVGQNFSQKVNIRLIAATNKNLEEEVKAGNFRADLFYRINVVPILVPSLQERKEDIPAFVEHFIRKYGGLNGQRVRKVSKRALAMLINYSWPGNVRELENVIQRAVTFADSDEITPEVLPDEIRIRKPDRTTSHQYEGKLSDIEKVAILETLQEMQGNKRKTAEKLGISKATLWRKLKMIQNSE
ncbi:MAG: sigma-54-dependent transcriptional regulator [bacterium]